MKFGIRKRSVSKSLKAMTTGKIKRSIKRSVDPLYGKKGVGLLKDPKKAVYNKMYKKTTLASPLPYPKIKKLGAVSSTNAPSEKHDEPVFIWSAILDEKTCVACRILDGHVVDRATAESSPFVPGQLHEGCRCRWVRSEGSMKPKITGLPTLDELKKMIAAKQPGLRVETSKKT